MSILEVKNLSHTYSPNIPLAEETLKDINLSTDKGDFMGIADHTGSGGSTPVQYLNGLIIPAQGDVLVDRVSLKRTKNPKEARKRVGTVFQYPEHQLSEETATKDIASGFRNLGLPLEEVKERVGEVLDRAQLSQDLKDRFPFELSGGQKRRVAIMGTLAMKPCVLISDEPTAGLDPHGRGEILSEINRLYQQGDMTILVVSHNMGEVAKLAQRMVVMSHGQVIVDGISRELLVQGKRLEKLSLTTPQVAKVMEELRSGGADVATDAITLDEAYGEIKNYLKGVDHA